MPAVLPFIALALLVPICRRFSDSWRWALLLASVMLGIAATVLAEGLSLFGVISFWPLVCLWGILCIGLIIFNVLMLARKDGPSFAGWGNLDGVSRILLACVGFIVLVCGFIAIIAPPNDWDSLA